MLKITLVRAPNDCPPTTCLVHVDDARVKRARPVQASVDGGIAAGVS
jgi:hypothetical protein